MICVLIQGLISLCRCLTFDIKTGLRFHVFLSFLLIISLLYSFIIIIITVQVEQLGKGGETANSVHLTGMNKLTCAS